MLLGGVRRRVVRCGLRLGLGGRGRRLPLGLPFIRLDPRLRLLRLRLLILRSLPPLIPAIGGNHAIVMFGVLKKVFCADAIPRRERVLRQGLVFLDDLKGGSSDLSFGAVALEG